MVRARDLTIEIYQKMLRIIRNRDGRENITIREFDHVQYRPYYSVYSPRYSIVLSCALLDRMTMDGRIPFSFTNFITTQELSGPFYISPDIYHTQITEYSLLTFYEWALFSLLSSWKIFLIMLDPSIFLVTSKRIGALWITSPELFQPIRFLIYSEQFVQNPLRVTTLHNCLIWWRLLLSGLRSVLGNEIDSLKPLGLTIRSALGTWFQATERLVRSLPKWTSNSSSQRKISVNVTVAFHNHQILYILNIPAIIKASAYPEIQLVHRLVNCVSLVSKLQNVRRLSEHPRCASSLSNTVLHRVPCPPACCSCCSEIVVEWGPHSYYPEVIKKWKGFPPPENRLFGAMIGSPVLVIGIFWLGWTGQYANIPWYVPALSTIFFGVGISLIFMSFLVRWEVNHTNLLLIYFLKSYLIDTYL